MNTTMDKVCDMCGDVGFDEDIATCSRCKKISEHIYCMPRVLYDVPLVWHCEECAGNANPKRKLFGSDHPVVKKAKVLNNRSLPLNNDDRKESTSKYSSSEIHPTKTVKYNPPSKMVENGKTKFIPCEVAALLPGEKRKASTSRPKLDGLLVQVNQSNIKQFSAPRRASITNMPVTQVQLSQSKLTTEDPSSKKEGNLGSHTPSGKMARNQLCQKVPIESNCSLLAPTLPKDEERKRKTKPLKIYTRHLNEEDDIKEELVGESCDAKVPATCKEEDHATSKVLDNSEMEDELKFNKPLGKTICSNIELREPLMRDVDSPVTLLVVSNSEHPNRPVVEAQWRGDFEIFDTVSQIYHGIQAHIPGRVALKVYEFTRELPGKLKFKLYRRQDVWPKAFYTDPPTVDDIALFFFPGEMGSKDAYTKFVDLMKRCDLGLQCRLGDLELLLYTSGQLPNDSLESPQDMFMWGVFRRKYRRSEKKGIRLITREQWTK